MNEPAVAPDPSPTASSASFAAHQAIDAGQWDDFLTPLFVAIQRRRELYNHKKQPPRFGMASHQVWAWMNGPGAPHWEVRGTGAVLDPETERAHRERRAQLMNEEKQDG